MVLPGCFGPTHLFGNSWNDENPVFSMSLGVDNTIEHWPVLEDRQAMAQERLAHQRFCRLTEEEAKLLLGKAPGNREAGAPYLIRAVYLWKRPGAFYVSHDNGELAVQHGAMGWATVWRIKRYSLIVRLKAPPSRVIVTCGAAV